MFNSLLMKQWVSPFYLRILNGNYAFKIEVSEEREQFNLDVRRALDKITPTIAGKLIGGHWREAITGSWFAGLKRYTELRDQIGELLLASKTCFAGQSHAFAMACFADDASVKFLTRYLDTYLRRLDCFYDQNWAMPAMLWVDHINSTDHASEYLKPGGLWGHFTADKVTPEYDAWTIDSCKRNFWRTMEYCRDNFMDLST